MKIRLLVIFTFVFCVSSGNAQKTPLEIKYRAWDIHALRYYPFAQTADSLMKRVIDRNPILEKKETLLFYKKTGLNLTFNQQLLTGEMDQSTASRILFYKYILPPYKGWLNYARPVRENAPDLNLSLFLSEDYSPENRQPESSTQSIFRLIGTENVKYYLDEWLGEADLLQERSNVLFLSVKSPLAKDALDIYRYFLSSRTKKDGIPVYEIVFFSKKATEKAFEGYLYIAESDLSLVQAVFTLNYSIEKGSAKAVLFTQTPAQKETLLYLGDDLKYSLSVEQIRVQASKSGDSIPSAFRSPAQKEISGLIEEAKRTKAYSNVENAVSFLLTNRIGIFQNRFELGPVSQMLSYNFMEGLRLRMGGFTSPELCKFMTFGGYLAYGTSDKQWKYAGDIAYTPSSSSRIKFTYVNDLNIPGYDLLKSKRDLVFYSLYQAKTTSLSLQKIGQLSYEKEVLRRFSLKINAKYGYDRPLGNVRYIIENEGVRKQLGPIVNTEIGVLFRFAPNEKYIRIKDHRLVFRSPDIDFNLEHRIGIKGIFGSGYDYHITRTSLSKSFDFPLKTSALAVSLSAGKVWNSLPFPLLFIPAGNQSYVFDSDDYNLMRFHEFVTDRFVAGNVDFRLDWSPIDWFFKKSKMETHLGMKTIYGPLSERNNPQLHPELFVFNSGIGALGEKPYAEANIGLANIFNFLRIDYVHRLTYKQRGSLFFSVGFRF